MLLLLALAVFLAPRVSGQTDLLITGVAYGPLPGSYFHTHAKLTMAK